VPAQANASDGAAPPAASVLRRVQQGLEALYRVDTQLDVQLFVVSDGERARTLGGDGNTTRRPREQLLITQHASSAEGGELAIGLYLDDRALENLENNDPQRGLGEHNFADFCLAVEGVSHFIYVALCAAANRQVTALELELQAEVDKFVSCLLLDEAAFSRPTELRARLYEKVRLADDLDREERERYATANHQAHRYTGALERRYPAPARLSEMLTELRHFYRFPLQAKLAHIARSAA
jgi:hypothetical protein